VTRYLVDTNVISATAPAAAVKRAALIEWMDAHSSALFLSAVTIAEIADLGGSLRGPLVSKITAHCVALLGWRQARHLRCLVERHSIGFKQSYQCRNC